MPSSNIREALVRLLATQTHSLAMYLTYTSPWMRDGDNHAMQVVSQVVEDQKQIAARVFDHMQQLYGRVDSGEFPMEFTSTHDLSLEYLVKLVIASQQQDIKTLEACVRELSADPTARVLAEEALGEARGHLESLVELTSQPT